MHHNYFEGILQLRNPNEEILNFMTNQIQKNKQKLAKTEELKQGIDMYFQNKKFMASLATKIIKEFGGKTKKTATLHTKNKLTSKELYRQTIFIEFPDFFKKDILEIENNIYLVTDMKKKLGVFNLIKEKKEKIRYPNKYKILKKEKTRIISLKPLKVLNPVDFQPVIAKNPLNKKINENKEVRVIMKDFAYLI